MYHNLNMLENEKNLTFEENKIDTNQSNDKSVFDLEEVVNDHDILIFKSIVKKMRLADKYIDKDELIARLAILQSDIAREFISCLKSTDTDLSNFHHELEKELLGKQLVNTYGGTIETTYNEKGEETRLDYEHYDEETKKIDDLIAEYVINFGKKSLTEIMENHREIYNRIYVSTQSHGFMEGSLSLFNMYCRQNFDKIDKLVQEKLGNK